MSERYAVDCNILWHQYDANGKLLKSAMTHLVGHMHHLLQRIRENEVESDKLREAGKPYYVAAQIIPNRLPV